MRSPPDRPAEETLACVQFSVRALAGLGSPWSVVRTVETVEAARDELLAWTPPPEPQLLRVASLLAEPPLELVPFLGDWLLHPDHALPRPLHRPNWTVSTDRWSPPDAWVDVWETCPNVTWLLQVAVGVPRPLFARALAAVARDILERRRGVFTPAEHAFLGRALDQADAWSWGHVERDVLRTLAFDLDAWPLRPSVTTVGSFGVLAVYAAVAAPIARETRELTSFATDVALACGQGTDAEARAFHAEASDRVRAVIPLATFLELQVAPAPPRFRVWHCDVCHRSAPPYSERLGRTLCPACAFRPPLGLDGPCEAVEPIAQDDGEVHFAPCGQPGRVIREVGANLDRHRCVCGPHGLDTAPADARGDAPPSL